MNRRYRGLILCMLMLVLAVWMPGRAQAKTTTAKKYSLTNVAKAPEMEISPESVPSFWGASFFVPQEVIRVTHTAIARIMHTALRLLWSPHTALRLLWSPHTALRLCGVNCTSCVLPLRGCSRNDVCFILLLFVCQNFTEVITVMLCPNWSLL